jgi:hypothetical protein
LNPLLRSIKKIIEGGINAFMRFPASVLCALAFTIVTMIRIQLDWQQQEPYNFLFNCLHLALAFGALFSMALITVAQSRSANKNAAIKANVLALAGAIVAFLLLYFFGSFHPDQVDVRYTYVSELAAARISMAMLVSLFAFMLLAAFPKERSDFARSFFMTHKAFFIALIYGGVLIAGFSGVAGAVQVLLYQGMSEKVYMYIAAVVGFLAFSIFLGYFPDFSKDKDDEHREIAQKQPRFIEILFGFIMVPIIIALTAVLLLWSGRTIATGTWPVFEMLAGIAVAYSFGGLWLHVMVTRHETGIATFYRKFYPFAVLVILAFEAAALVKQLSVNGLKIAEYSFALIWLVAAAAAVLLIIKKEKAHQTIVIILCAAAIISVLPVVGYYALPVSAQTGRLERLLTTEGILADGQLKPAASEPDRKVREAITDAVYYIADAEGAKPPVWFDMDLNQQEVFKEKLGFEPVWPDQQNEWNGGKGSLSTSLYLKPGVLDISGYQWSILSQDEYWNEKNPVVINGKQGVYNIEWNVGSTDGIPTLRVLLDDKLILTGDMNPMIDRITSKYPPGQPGGSKETTVDEMSMTAENDMISVRLVFSNINVNVDPQNDRITYGFNLRAMYFMER